MNLIPVVIRDGREEDGDDRVENIPAAAEDEENSRKMKNGEKFKLRAGNLNCPE
jgi:hypothetical protein